MSEKCAIYLRVSSDIQDYERQISDMKKFAKDNHFTVSKKKIYEDKLSGFKNEKEREGLNKLLSEVVPLGIRNILVWEISRLARKHRDLLEITEFFQVNGINVYFFIQRFWLLDETLNISPQAGLSIAFFGWHGEYEARLTKERFISAKKLNESLGKYNGGKITFGYTLDKDNKYIINTTPIKGIDVSESNIVKEVFDLYEEGLTCSKICRICRSKRYPKIVCNTHTLARVLRDTSYVGYKDVKLGRRPTPKIISTTQFKLVGNLIDTNKTKADKAKRHVYLLRGLIKCSYCGSYYVGKQTDDAYICSQNSGSNRTNNNSSCKGSNISTSNIDGVIWENTKIRLTYMMSAGYDDNIEGSGRVIKELEEQINSYKNLILRTEQKRKKSNIIFQNDGYTVEEYQKALKAIIKEKQECEREIEKIESKINYYKKLREESNKLSSRRKNINSITDRNQIKTIIKGMIESIVTYKCSPHKTVVFINYLDGAKDALIYNSVAKKGIFFKSFDSKYIRFDWNTKSFYFLKDKGKTVLRVRIKVLKERGIGEDLPDVITIQEFSRLVRLQNINDINDIDFSKYFEPYPDKHNSIILDFDGLMNHEDILSILSTFPYNKMTYFKDLNKKRFSRKKIVKKDNATD